VSDFLFPLISHASFWKQKNRKDGVDSYEKHISETRHITIFKFWQIWPRFLKCIIWKKILIYLLSDSSVSYKAGIELSTGYCFNACRGSQSLLPLARCYLFFKPISVESSYNFCVFPLFLPFFLLFALLFHFWSSWPPLSGEWSSLWHSIRTNIGQHNRKQVPRLQG